jgi:hypothetical protein
MCGDRLQPIAVSVIEKNFLSNAAAAGELEDVPEFQRIWKISFHVFSYFGNSLTSSMVSM